MGFSPIFAAVGAFGSAPLPPFGGADASLPAPLGHKGCSYSTLALGAAGCLLLGDFVCTPIRGCSNVNLKGGNFSVQSVTHKKVCQRGIHNMASPDNDCSLCRHHAQVSVKCQRGIIQRDPHPFHYIRFSLSLQIVN